MNLTDESRTIISDSVDKLEQKKKAYETKNTGASGSSSVVYSIGDSILNLYEVKSNPYMGGMGSVVKIHHSTWNVDLAMKQPRDRFLDKEKRKIFFNECESWINLGLHPNIVTCYYVRNIDGIPSIFSEWMDNGSLKGLIESRQLYKGPRKDILIHIIDIMIQTACGLAYAHSKKLIHQDVKSANILCGKDGSVKIADFGLANIKKLSFSYGSSTASVTTLAENGGYTLLYCSPEQMKGHPVSMRTDIWSWAVTALEMFVGGCKWTSGPLAGYAFANYLDHAVVEIIPEIRDLLSRCFKENESERPHDFREIIEELKKIYLKISGIIYDLDSLSVSKQSAEFLNNKALSFHDLGKLDDAERIWQEALSISPFNPEVNYNYTLYRWRCGKITEEEAFSILDQLYKKTSLPEIIKWQALLLCESGQYSLARTLLDSEKIPYHDIAPLRENKSDVLEVRKEIKIMGTAHPLDGIAFDYSSNSIVVCAHTQNNDCVFYRMRENETELHIEHIFHQQEDVNAIISFVIVNHGKNFLMRRIDGTLDLYDAKTYRFIERFYKPKQKEDINYIAANKSGSYIVENCSQSGANGLYSYHRVWDVAQKKVLGIIKPDHSAIFGFFSGENMILIPDADEYQYHIMKNGTIKTIKNEEMLYVGTMYWYHQYHQEIKGYLFSSHNSQIYSVNSMTKQCLTSQKMNVSFPKAVGISADNSLIYLHGENKILIAPFYGHAFRADWKLSRIVSISDAQVQKKKFKALYDLALKFYESGDYKKALEKIEAASGIPGYNNDSQLMALNREVGKYCKRIGFRNIEFDVKQFRSQYRHQQKWADYDQYVLDRSRRYLKIEENKLLDLVTGKTIIVDDKYNQVFLPYAGKSLDAYLDSKGTEFTALRDVLKLDLISLLNVLFPTQFAESKQDECMYSEINELETIMVTIQKSGTICVWDFNTGKKIRSIQNSSAYLAKSMSINGHYLAIKDNYKNICIWDLIEGKKKKIFDERELEELGFSTASNITPVFLDDNTVALYSDLGRIVIWNIEKSKPTVKVSTRGLDHYGYCDTCSISNDQCYGIVSRNKYLSLIDFKSGSVIEYVSHGDFYLPEFPKFSFTQNKNILISISDIPQKHNEIHYVNWKYQFPGWVDWNVAAQPYLKNFLKVKPKPSKADIDELMQILQNHDLGWIRRAGIEKKIEEMTKTTPTSGNKLTSHAVHSGKTPESKAPIIDKTRNEQFSLPLVHPQFQYLLNMEKKKEQYRNMGLCEFCGGKFKGLFDKTCRKCGRKKNY